MIDLYFIQSFTFFPSLKWKPLQDHVFKDWKQNCRGKACSRCVNVRGSSQGISLSGSGWHMLSQVFSSVAKGEAWEHKGEGSFYILAALASELPFGGWCGLCRFQKSVPCSIQSGVASTPLWSSCLITWPVVLASFRVFSHHNWKADCHCVGCLASILAGPVIASWC